MVASTATPTATSTAISSCCGDACACGETCPCAAESPERDGGGPSDLPASPRDSGRAERLLLASAYCARTTLIAFGPSTERGAERADRAIPSQPAGRELLVRIARWTT